MPMDFQMSILDSQTSMMVMVLVLVLVLGLDLAVGS